MPNLFDSIVFVEFRDTLGNRYRTEARLPEPVSAPYRQGPAQILGIPGRWVNDMILLDRPVTPQNAQVIRDRCRESVQREFPGRPVADNRDQRWMFDETFTPENHLAAHNRYLLDRHTRMEFTPTYPRPTAELIRNPPPRAPRCACGDRGNVRWEHHSGGCTYLDPDVSDYLDEGADEEDEDD